MELYRKENCFTREVEYLIMPEDKDRPHNYYDGPAGELHYEFIDFVKRGERFYRFYCRNTDYESGIYWEKKEAKNEMEDYHQDLQTELNEEGVEEEVETWIVTYVVKRCGNVNDGGLEVK